MNNIFHSHINAYDLDYFEKNYRKMLCQEKIAMTFIGDLQSLVSECQVYRISEPLTSTWNTLVLPDFSPFTDVFRYR